MNPNSAEPRVIAHRGASAAYPENTVEAFAAAGRLGADWVELDVRRTVDGLLAVHHDARLGDGRAIVDMEQSALPASVPDLTAALTACDGLGVNVEIKNSPSDPDFDPTAAIVQPTVEAIRSWGGDVIVSSFDPATIDHVRGVAPDLPTALLTFLLADPADAIDACVRAGHRALHPYDATVTAEVVARCHDAGLLVNVWTVDDPARIRELADFGVDGVVTNVPDVARRALDSLSSG
jgi:glycerophosphoryl diester phosphodiesterase